MNKTPPLGFPGCNFFCCPFLRVLCPSWSWWTSFPPCSPSPVAPCPPIDIKPMDLANSFLICFFNGSWVAAGMDTGFAVEVSFLTAELFNISRFIKFMSRVVSAPPSLNTQAHWLSDVAVCNWPLPLVPSPAGAVGTAGAPKVEASTTGTLYEPCSNVQNREVKKWSCRS